MAKAWYRLTAVVFFVGMASLAAQEAFVPGVRPPTPEEIAEYTSKATTITAIRVNQLGLVRMNEAGIERAAKENRGIAAQLDMTQAVPLGEEIVGVPALMGVMALSAEGEEGSVPLITASGEPVVGALPKVVDNSELACFPPIRSQGSIGSCASFSTTYYQMTHMTALARGWDAKSGGDGFRMSPEWTYPLVNGGSDSGSSMMQPAIIEMQHGTATLAEMPYHQHFREWSTSGTVWRNAISRRIAAMGNVYGFDTEEGLTTLKTLLLNGYVLTFSTGVFSWEQKLVKDDLSTTDDDTWVGQYICRYSNGYNGPHGMTIVGYNDYIWCDINGNNVVDDGEKGALKIANSWGSGDWNGGFRWISYDALKRVSAVAGGPTASRQSAFTSGYWVTARTSYTPEMVGVFTLNHAKRRQMYMKIGKSGLSVTLPTDTWSGNALSWNGGEYAFDGSTTACDGTFALDFTELAPVEAVSTRYYCGMQDTNWGPEGGVIKGFELQKADGTVLATCSDVPKNVADNTTEYVYIDYTFNRDSTGTVTVQATDASASETGPDNGQFRITRTGSTASAMNVNFEMSGLASLTSDYMLKCGAAVVGGAVTVPAGTSYVDIDLIPIDDWLVEGKEPATLTVKTGYGYTVGAAKEATVNIADDDTVYIITDRTLWGSSYAYMYVPEGGTSTFRVKLTAVPASDVMVTTKKSYGDSDITLTGGTSLNFTTSTWNTWQMVTLSAAEDADEYSGMATVECTAPGISKTTVNVMEIDNDACNLVADKYAVDIPEGGTAQFGIKCNVAPAAAFSVTVKTGSGDRDITIVGPTTIDFSPSDWNTWKYVTLAAAEDMDGFCGNREIYLQPSDTKISGVSSIIAWEVDNDTPGPGLIVSSYDVTVTECSTTNFQVKLTSKPTGTLTANVSRTSGDTDIRVKDGAAFTFNADNWCQNQTVTLEALQDADALNGIATIRCEIAGTAKEEITATERDIDAVQTEIDPQSINVLEGSTASFQVRLTSQPPSDVTVNTARYSGDMDITVSSGANLSFTTANWNVWKTVTLAAAEDADSTNGWTQFKLTGTGVADGWAGAQEADNDAVFMLLDKTSLEVPEGGSSDFELRLSAIPAGDTTVSVTISGDSDVTVASGASLTFTTSNWMVPQIVTIAAAQDADAKNDWASATCAATGLQSVYVSCSEEDDDRADIVAEVSSITVPEGGSSIFRIKLSALPPTLPQTVTVTRTNGDTDLTVSGGASIVFNSGNWNVWQTVTISAAEDADMTNGWATFRCSGTWESGLNETSAKATEADNDIPNTPPTAVLDASPTNGTAPLGVFFEASASSDSDGSIVLYEYDFDYDGVTFTVDDSGAALTTTDHTYSSPGTYTAAVRVTDNGTPGLKDIDTITITVSAGDTTAPGVILSSAVIYGTATDNSGTPPTVTVDGTPVTLSGDDFFREVTLSGNPDVTPIVAEDGSGNTRTVHLTVSH